MASMVWARAAGAPHTRATRTCVSAMRLVMVLGLRRPCPSIRDLQGHAMHAPQATLVSPRVVDPVVEPLEPPLHSGSERQPGLAVLAVESLVAGAERHQVPIRRLDAAAHALGVVVGMRGFGAGPQQP